MVNNSDLPLDIGYIFVMENGFINLLGSNNFYRRPVFLFLFVYMGVLFFPAIYLNITGYSEAMYFETSLTDRSNYYGQNLIANCLFLFGLLCSIFIVKTSPSVKINFPQFFITGKKMRALGYFSAAVCTIYFLLYGSQKLSNLGTELSPKEFRALGFDDVPVFWALALEVTRKVFFPILIAYFFVTKHKIYFWAAIFFFLLGALSTLDRFPFLMVLVFSFYCSYQSTTTLSALVLKLFIMVVLLGLAASVLTYVQYNRLDVDLGTILSSASDFLLHRVLLVPSFAATEIGFRYADIHGFFNLQYSRLGFLFGVERIGFNTDGHDPYFVAPVGVTADVFRNFGYLGVVLVSVFFGWFLVQFARVRSDNIDPGSRGKLLFIKGFLIINLSTYLVFGNFFTMGVFAVLASCYLIKNCKFEELSSD